MMKEKRNLVFMFVLAAVVLTGALINITLPGLYMDAVNPDYWSTGLLLNKYGNVCWILPHVGIPLIGQIYHGTVTFLIGTPIFLIFGSTVTILRIVNACYGIIAVILVYMLLKKLTNSIIAFSVTLCLASSIALIACFRTQIYIMIPGSAMLLLSMYLLSSFQQSPSKRIVLSGLFAGLAFYSYFVYLFYAPAFLVIIFIFCGRKLGNIRKWLLGFIIPASLYALAYLAIVVRVAVHTSKMQWIIYIGAIIGLLILFGFPFYKVFWNKRLRKIEWVLYISFFLLLFFMTAVADMIALKTGRIMVVVDEFKTLLEGLGVAGRPAPVLSRILISFGYISYILKDFSNEELIFQSTTSILGSVTGIIILITTIGAAGIALKNRKKYTRELKYAGAIILFILSFLIMSIPFSTRLGTHHFFSIMLLLYLLLGINIKIIYDYFRTRKGSERICMAVISVVLTFIIGLNVYNQILFQKKLLQTGGVGYTSEQVDVLAATAVKNDRNKNDTVYVFPEWGFMMEFNFLTRNSVPYVDNANEDTIKHLISEDKTVILCCWNQQQLNKYSTILQEYGMKITGVQSWIGRDAQIEFYSIKAE